MLKKMSKCIITMLALVICLNLSHITPAFAVSMDELIINKPVENVSLVDITEKYIRISNGKFYIIDKETLKHELKEKWSSVSKNLQQDITVDEVVIALENRFAELNMLSEQKSVNITDDGQIYDLSPVMYQASGESKEYHWWGVKRIFYSDDSARDYAYKLRMVGHGNAGAAAIAGAVFGGVGAIPNGLGAAYAYSIADTVDYNANKSGDGVILEVHWILTYNCYPR